MRRNKRCLLAYHRTRSDKLEELVWKDADGPAGGSGGGGGPGAKVSSGDGSTSSLSPQEEEYVRSYGDLLAAYKGQWTDIDLTGSLEPPRDLFIDVRVLKDAGEIQTEYGSITLTKNTGLKACFFDSCHLMHEKWTNWDPTDLGFDWLCLALQQTFLLLLRFGPNALPLAANPPSLLQFPTQPTDDAQPTPINRPNRNSLPPNSDSLRQLSSSTGQREPIRSFIHGSVRGDLAPVDSAEYLRHVREDTAELASYLLSDKKSNQSPAFLSRRRSQQSQAQSLLPSEDDDADYGSETIHEVSEPPSPHNEIQPDDELPDEGPSILTSLLRKSPPQSRGASSPSPEPRVPEIETPALEQKRVYGADAPAGKGVL
ncbi:DNA replication complex GINS protein PSF1 like [Verticillium longisporum]|nr:DNA replication complex GINS protein PSF1 like [Verticillium longisporum]